MADFVPSSAGEAGGIFAGVVATLGLIGAGLKWLLNWKDARDTTRTAKLDAWHTELARREHDLDAKLARYLDDIEGRMQAAEAALQECKTREEAQGNRLNDIETRQRMLAATLRAAWPLDYDIPSDMIVLLDRIDAEIRARAAHG